MPRAKKIAASPEDELVDQFLKIKAKSKAVFCEQKKLEEQLLARLNAEEGNRMVLASGRVLARKDNFADSNTQFKNTAMQRFEVVVA